MRSLLIGDMHVTPNNLEDAGEIFQLIDEVLEEQTDISLVCFLGDSLHTHSVVRQEVAFFLKRSVEKLIEKYKNRIPDLNWVFLSGNHDYSTPNAVVKDNAVRLILGDLATVVDDGPQKLGPFVFMPFVGDNEEFLKMTEFLFPETILVCHQTFDGSKYENNHTAPGGVDQNQVPCKLIISGHIHMGQNLKNDHNEVWYPGTPRALTAAEVNQDKFIWIFDSETGERIPIPTCTRVKEYKAFYFAQGCVYEVKEGAVDFVVQKNWKDKDDVRIYVEGSEEFCDQVLAANKHLEGQVRFIPNVQKIFSKALDLDSEGASVEGAMKKYVYDIYNMSDDLRDSVWQKLQTWMPKLDAKI